jgi:vacuolar-type H+-ATPase subunit I/STV1
MDAEMGETGGEDTEEERGAMPMQANEEAPATAVPEVSSETQQAPPQVEGRRTQLKIIRENIEFLSGEIGSFRKKHEASAKKLEVQVASLRKELVTHVRSHDLGEHVKSHERDTKRLEKQIVSLRNELAAVRSQVAKEADKSRTREEAVLLRILEKIRTTKPSKKPARKSRKPRKKA